MAIQHGNIAIEESATVTARVATVTIPRGSTNEQQEILTLGDPESSLGLARVVAAAPDSTHYGVVVRQVGYAAPSTTVNVSSVAGVVSVNLQSTASVRVYQSTAADLNVTVAGYVAPSTTVAISTGSVRVHQSSAADLNVTVAGYSTTANVSSVGGIVTVRPSDTNWASSAGFHFDGSGNLNVAGTFSASTTVNVSSAAGRLAIAGYHQSGSIVNVTDSTNNAINVNVVAGAAGGSTVMTLSQVLSTSGDGVIVGDTANSAIRVNVVAGAAGGSTIVTVSTGSVRVHQSSAADLNVTVAGYVAPSTTVNVSSLAGAVQARLYDSSGVAIIGSTASPAVGANALAVRNVLPTRNSTRILVYIQTAGGSTTLVSSVASQAIRVFGYSITSTVVGISSCAFLSSAASEKWGLMLGSGSSGITGANLAVAVPGSIFETASGEALGFSASSTGHYSVSVAWFTE